MPYKETQKIEFQYGLRNCNTGKIRWFLHSVDAERYKTSAEQSARILGYEVKFEYVKREAHIKTVKTVTYGEVRKYHTND